MLLCCHRNWCTASRIKYLKVAKICIFDTLFLNLQYLWYILFIFQLPPNGILSGKVVPLCAVKTLRSGGTVPHCKHVYTVHRVPVTDTLSDRKLRQRYFQTIGIIRLVKLRVDIVTVM
jgi:hypothetical protein